MRKLLLVSAVALALVSAVSGCATLQNLQNAWAIVSTAAVSPQQIVVAGNAFDAAEATATQFLLWCNGNRASVACTTKIRRDVIVAVRAGRGARNALEPYVLQGKAGPAVIYNALITAINTLQQDAQTVPAVVQSSIVLPPPKP
jgi:hypothetical protein